MLSQRGTSQVFAAQNGSVFAAAKQTEPIRISGSATLAPVDGHKLGIEAGTESLPINGDGSSVFAAAKSGYQLDSYGSDPRRIG